MLSSQYLCQLRFRSLLLFIDWSFGFYAFFLALISLQNLLLLHLSIFVIVLHFYSILVRFCLVLQHQWHLLLKVLQPKLQEWRLATGMLQKAQLRYWKVLPSNSYLHFRDCTWSYSILLKLSFGKLWAWRSIVYQRLEFHSL